MSFDGLFSAKVSKIIARISFADVGRVGTDERAIVTWRRRKLLVGALLRAALRNWLARVYKLEVVVGTAILRNIGIVVIRRAKQWRAARPAAHELCPELFGCHISYSALAQIICRRP